MRAVPREYHGVLFRSTLEADWAATLDQLAITWSYEPLLVDLGRGMRYLCDFYLPAQRSWLEVKGPHNQRIEKTRQLHAALRADPWDWRTPLVLVGRVPERGRAVWHGIAPGQDIILRACTRCEHTSFIDHNGAWCCQVCGWWEKHGAAWWASGELLFVKAGAP